MARTGLAIALFAATAGYATAQGYPARPVHLVVPQASGGATDILGRLVSERLVPRLGQQLVIDNKPGAGGNIAAAFVARAPADGYTLMLANHPGVTTAPTLSKNPGFDPVRDFAPVTQLSKFPNLLAAHPSFAAKTLHDVIALAKARPGTINYASAGTGTGTHMSAELLKQMTGIDIVQIPYKGGGPAAIAAIGGQTQLIIGTTVGLLPHVRSGKLRAVAVTSAKRAAVAPEIATFAESGAPGYEHEPWNGLLAPAKTPAAIIAKLNAEVVRNLGTPEVKKIFANEGAEAVGNSPEAFAVIVKSETAKWAKVIKTAGIKID